MRKILFLGIIFGFWACEKNKIYSKTASFQKKGWHKNAIQKFNFSLKEPSQNYYIFIILENDDTYKFQNIFLIITFQGPDKKVIKDTLEYEMADFKGNWLGSGFFTKTSRLFYKENIQLKKGNYKISIEQAVREVGKEKGVEQLKGIRNVGLTISKITY